jgi:putative hemolysin
MSEIIILAILIILSAFFSGSEVAIVSVNHVKARTLEKQGLPGSKALRRLKDNSRKTIITILIGNNIVNIAAASMATVIATEAYGSSGLGIATGVMTLVVLVFGEITPKTFASTHSDKVALAIARPIEILSYLLYPLIIFFEWVSIFMSKLVKVKKHEPVTESEIKTMIEFGVEKKIIEPEEKYIMDRAFKFSEITAYEAMTPLKDAFVLNNRLNVKKALDKIIENGYSRVPVYTGSKKNITGVVFIKDILEVIHEKKYKKALKDVATEPLFVPKYIAIDDLFKVFQTKQRHIAIVKDDENVLGLVTLEDLLEELVGEITDESDVTPNTIIRVNKNTIVAHGNTLVTKINKFFNVALPTRKKDMELYEFVKQHVKKPSISKKFRIGEITFILEDVRDNEILKIRIIKKDDLLKHPEYLLKYKKVMK